MNPRKRAAIFGATPAGIACAVRCAREGLEALLIHPGGHLGGMMSAGIGIFDTNYAGERCPLWAEIRGGILGHYAGAAGPDSRDYRLARDNLTFEPKVAEAVLTALVRREPNLRVLAHAELTGVRRAGRRIVALELRRGESGTAERIQADYFVDASYEGDLAAAAGAPYRVGRESRAEHGEPHAGRLFTRKEDRHAESEKFPYEAAHGFLRLRTFDSCSGRIFPGSTGEGDGRIMAYNFRIFLSRDPSNQVPIPRPRRYDRNRYAGMLEPEARSWRSPHPLRSRWLLGAAHHFRFRNHREIPGDKICWNHGDFPGGNHRYPEAGPRERAEIRAAHLEHELGLLWFLREDPAVPETVREQARALGLAKDEFADNGNLPWDIYVREARRIRGRYLFREMDACLAPGLDRAPPHRDSVAIAEWMMDSHDCSAERQPGSNADGCFMLSEATRPSQIPYRCLLPEGIDNLLVPVCLSATHAAWGTVRTEPVWIQLGEAAGFALAQAAARQAEPAAIDIPALQRELVGRGWVLGFFNDAGPVPHPAIQYFSGRGFFAGYEARPHEPLDRATADVWIDAVWDELLGLDTAAERARQLPRVPGAAISRSDLMARIRSRRRAHLGRDAPAAGAAGSESVTRAQGCEILFSLAAP